MDNLIIAGILVVIVLIALNSARKHFKGQGGCCGGGSDYKPRKKKLKNIIATKVFKVEGMHCEKCSNRVTETVNDIPFAAGMVDLKKGTLTVSCEQDVPDEQIIARIQRLGYTVTKVQ